MKRFLSFALASFRNSPEQTTSSPRKHRFRCEVENLERRELLSNTPAFPAPVDPNPLPVNPVVIGNGPSQPQSTLNFALGLSDPALYIKNPPSGLNYSAVYNVQIDGEQLLVQPSATSSNWNILARGVDGTLQESHDQGAPVNILGIATHDAGFQFTPDMPGKDITEGGQIVNGPEIVLTPGGNSITASLKVIGFNPKAGDTLQVVLPQVTGNQLPSNLPNGLIVNTGHGYQFSPGSEVISQEDPSNFTDGNPLHNIDLLFNATPAAKPGTTPLDLIIRQAGTPDITLHLNVDVVAPPVTAPGAPTGLMAKAVSPTQINLSFNPVPGATGYAVQAFIGGRFQTITVLNGNGATSVGINGLAPSTTYAFRVGAFNSANMANPTFPNSYQTAMTLAVPTPAPTMPTMNPTTPTTTSAPLQITAPSQVKVNGLTAALGGISLSSTNAKTIITVQVTTTLGTLQFGTTNGVKFSGNKSGTLTLQGTASAVNHALSTLTLHFTKAHSKAKLTVTASDGKHTQRLTINAA